MSRETYSQPVEFLLPVGCLLFAPISSRFAGKIGKIRIDNRPLIISYDFTLRGEIGKYKSRQ